MRKFALRFGLAGAALWIIVKLLVFFSGKSIDLYEFSLMANNFFLLGAVSLTIFMFKKSENFKEVPQLEDIKAGIFGGIIYTTCVALFSFYYNSNIDISVLQNKIEQRIEQVQKAIEKDADFELFKKQNPDAAKYSREQILQKERESTANFLNPKVSALLLMMFFTLLTILYAFFVSVAIRKIYLRGLR